MIRQKIMQLHSSKQAQKSRKKGLIELRLPLLLRKKGLIELRLPLLLRIKGVIRPRLTSLLRIKGVIRPRLTQLLRIKMSDHTATNPIAPDKKKWGQQPRVRKRIFLPSLLERGVQNLFGMEIVAGRGRIFSRGERPDFSRGKAGFLFCR